MQLPTSAFRAWAWPGILTVATVIGSLVAACLMPFAALASIAAATLPLGRAMGAVLAAWAFNQAVGFGWLGFPHTAQAAAQGASLAIASLTAVLAARAAGVGGGSLARLGLGFAAGFAAYEAVLFAGAHFTGGLWTFAPAYVAQIALAEAVWFALLGALSLAVQRATPAVAPPRPIRLRPA